MRVAHVMMVNAATHYACLAMLDLAIHGNAESPVRASDITARNAIPGPYLVQILRTLKSHGWVHATRGSQGGYRLVVQPDAVTLLDIAEAIGGGDVISHGESDPQPSEDLGQRVLRECWQAALESARGQLSQVRLGDLVRQCRDQGAAMFYI